jgi:DNA-binding GntR family transcriptional regulator
MEQAAAANDLPRLVEADLRFHDIVISSSGQTHTVQIWRTIWPRIRAYFYRYGRGKDLATMVEEHRELLAALQTRDPALMRAQLDLHIAVPSPPAIAQEAPKRRKAAKKKPSPPVAKAGT